MTFLSIVIIFYLQWDLAIDERDSKDEVIILYDIFIDHHHISSSKIFCYRWSIKIIVRLKIDINWVGSAYSFHVLKITKILFLSIFPSVLYSSDLADQATKKCWCQQKFARLFNIFQHFLKLHKELSLHAKFQLHSIYQ